MNLVKYLLILIFLIILIGCTGSNDEDSNASLSDDIKSLDIDSTSSYSKYLNMLDEYEGILDKLANLKSAVETNDLDALLDVVKIGKEATQWVERWKKIIHNQDLTSDEITQLVEAYEKLLEKYKDLY